MYATLEDLADQAAGKDQSNLTYAAFGLGNKTYEQYNKVVYDIDTTLQKLRVQKVWVCRR